MVSTAIEGSEPAAPASPTAPAARVEGFDFARAVAILGMATVHFCLSLQPDSTPNWLQRFLDAIDGRPAALFMILAGIGISLRARSAVASGDQAAVHQARRILTRRGAFLLVVGYLNLIVWDGDILRVYGVSMFVAAVLLTGPARSLWAAIVLFIAGFIKLMLTIDYTTNWDFSTLTYYHLWTPVGIVRNLFYDGFRSVFPWTGLMIFGMWLGRLDWNDARLRRKAFMIAAGVALLTEVSSSLLVRHFTGTHALDRDAAQALFGTLSMPPLPMFLLAACGTAVAAIVLSLWMTSRFPTAWWVRGLVATGQLAFTWYLLHIVLVIGAALAAPSLSNRSWLHCAAAVVIFAALAMSVSSLIRGADRRGPMEWLLRRIAG